jgi:hypothetical protein
MTDLSLRVPYGYLRGERSLGEVQNILMAHYHPGYVRRIIPWLESKGGRIGVGGHWRATGSQPDKSGFAPEGKSFHQDQRYSDGFVGACAVDLVARNGTNNHRSPTWAEVPAQGSIQAALWGLHCNIGSEAWHMQPVEIDGWLTWFNNGRPYPRKDYKIPGSVTPAPTPTPPKSKEADVVVTLEVLVEGARSEDARRCQALLNARARGHGSSVDVVTEDAHYGAKTAGIIKFVQGESGLHIDGVCGPKTWTVLLGDG